MDLNGSGFCEQTEMPPQVQPSIRIKVRDMVKRYDTAVKSDSAKSSYSSMVSAKSSFFGGNTNNSINDSNISPTKDDSSNSLFFDGGHKAQDLGTRSPRIEMPNDIQVSQLETQKNFMNLSRTREPPIAAPREKKSRHSDTVLLPVLPRQQTPPQQEEHLHVTDSSYQSKTTISKTPNGVRIIIDIFFDQNKGLTIEDVVGSRVETDIPPSKILTEFQKRVAESSRY